jgi:hypothetical protein
LYSFSIVYLLSVRLTLLFEPLLVWPSVALIPVSYAVATLFMQEMEADSFILDDSVDLYRDCYEAEGQHA